MKTIPLTVLVHDGPMARAYLAALRYHGFKPERIIHLIYENHPATGKPVGRLLPKAMREGYQRKSQEASFFHWPRQLKKTHGKLVAAVSDWTAEVTGFSKEVFEAVLGEERLENFAETTETLKITNLKDARLQKAVEKIAPAVVLFTGGGIVPADLLNIPSLRVLHVHPGHLPEVRGSDGLLWSVLTRGRPGMSCFYMAPGIDTGDLIEAIDFPVMALNLPEQSLEDPQGFYRVLYSFCDPILRASLFGRIATNNETFVAIPSEGQDLNQGVTFHFMHEKLRARVYKKMLEREQ